MIGEDKIIKRLQEVLSLSKQKKAEIFYVGEKWGISRFANTTLHQNVVISEMTAYVRVLDEDRFGCVISSGIEKEELLKAIEESSQIAKKSSRLEPCPGFSPPSPPQFEPPSRYSESTTKWDSKTRAQAIKEVFKIVRENGLNAAGLLRTGYSELAVVNTLGLKQYTRGTLSNLTVFALQDDSSGYSSQLSYNADMLDIENITKTAVKKCLKGRSPLKISPGEYDVILEPNAVAELLEWLAYTSFGGREFEKGTSFLAGRIGQKVMGENITIYDDALVPTPQGFGTPFDCQGTWRKQVYLIKDGIAKGVVHDRYTAKRSKTVSTGHATPEGNDSKPIPANIWMKPGNLTLKEMIQKMKRGLLVTRFHYVNGLLDTRKALMTGMTRDGTFLIEGGEIGPSVCNLRFTESILEAFSRVEYISSETQAIPTWWTEIGAYRVPSLFIRGFKFTGLSEQT